MTITAAERKILQSEKDALLAEVAAIRSEAESLRSQAASAITDDQKNAITDSNKKLTARVRQISARLNEINALLAQATFPPEEGPQYTVTNYVTNQVVQTTNAPSYGNPNAEVQAQVNSAYFSAGSSSPSVSTVATPAALVIAAAQGSSNISADQLNQLTTSMGGLNQMGQTPIMLSNMTAHAKNVLDQPTRVFDAINLTYRPEEVGTIGRCNSLGGFIGSIQGVFNGTLNAITSGLNQITTALFSVPRAIIAGFTAATTALLGAITSGVQQAINTAISAVTTVTGGLFGALGEGVKSLVGAVGSAVNSVASAVQSEIANVANAINSMIQNPFRLIVPTVNPCVANIYKASNPAANNWTYLTPTGQGMIMPNSTQTTVPLTDAQAQLRRDAAAVTASIQEFNATF